MALISSDIFKSMEFVNNLQHKFYDVEDQTTLAVGTFGAEAELFGRTLQNAVRIASELSNEAIPVKAKFDKNVIAHAYSLGLNDLDAHPAYMPVQLIIPKAQVDEKMIADKFIWDCNIPINIENFEFHTDYDIILTRNKIGANKFVYTALYDMSIPNPVSDITKPYLPPVGIITIESGEMILISCIVRQVNMVTVNHRTLSDNDIENKTYTFSFDENLQLAAFDIEAIEGDKTYRITPVYDGAINSIEGYTCEYQYININKIRIKFSRESYLPKINTLININLKLTNGAAGNIPMPKDEVLIDVSSTKYNYRGLYAAVRPTNNSDEGRNKMSISQMKKNMPKEAISRGTIATAIDLDNFFNSFNSDDSKLYPYKKRYNGIDHIYYTYLVMKKNDNVVPTNTIDIAVNTEELHENELSYVIPPLSVFTYTNDIGRLAKPEDVKDLDDLTDFIYTNPFMIVINKNPVMVSYYLNIMEVTKFVEYSFINQSIQLQMIMSSLSIARSGVVDRNKYAINFQMTQNINTDFGIIERDPEQDNAIIREDIKVFLVFYNENSTSIPYRYIQCNLDSVIDETFVYSYSTALETDDTILVDNKIHIHNLCQPQSGLMVDSYLSQNNDATIFIMAKLDRVYGGEDPITNYIPDLAGYSLCNKYKIEGGIDLFYNYTQLMNSTPYLVKGDTEGEYGFEIKNIPMIRYSYMQSEYKIMSVTKELENRRKYMEYCLTKIEGGFDIDLKFVNTYGPSKRFFLKNDSNINRINLSLTFEAKLYSAADKYIIDLIILDIKDIIEDINSINEQHFSNLVTTIKNKYVDQLYYFEFLGFNGYGPGEQYIKKSLEELTDDAPEFLNINTLENGTPDIYINVI